MREPRTFPWVSNLRRRAEYCRRLALMQRDPVIANELHEMARRYEAEAAEEASLSSLRQLRAR